MSSSISQILQEFVTQPLGIQGIVLVTSQGQPLTPSIGIADDSSLIIAGMMLHLVERACEEYNWQEIERISLRTQEGCLIFIACSEEIFLLIQTANVPSGFLDRDINLLVSKLQTALNINQLNDLSLLWDNSQIADTDTTISNKLAPDFINRCQQELAEFIGPIAPIICQRILKQNPKIHALEFVKTLAKKIPNSEQALEFQRLLLK